MRKKQLVGVAVVAIAFVCWVVATLPRPTPFTFLQGARKRATLLEPSSVGPRVYEMYELDQPEAQVVDGCRAELGPAGFREEITDKGRIWRSGSSTVGLS